MARSYFALVWLDGVHPAERPEVLFLGDHETADGAEAALGRALVLRWGVESVESVSGERGPAEIRGRTFRLDGIDSALVKPNANGRGTALLVSPVD